VGLCLALVGMSRSALLDVDRITVAGADHTAVTTVLEASGIREGDPMLEVDLDEARAGIEVLPWVADVAMERDWPGQVHIAVSERTPIAVAPGEGGGWYLVDREGRLLAAVPEPGEEWLQLIDIVPGHRVGGVLRDDGLGALAVAEALTPSLREQVQAVAAVEDGYDLRLWTGPRVRVGDESDLDEKVRAAETVLLRVDDRCFGAIDVRVPRAPVVTRVPGCGLTTSEAPLDPPPTSG
jgi:cell division protein FtsQ